MATFIPNVTDVFPEPALFTPDFSFMDKMLSRRQALYDQGWAKVNSAYNFVNRDLTNPTNIKERDEFLKQAKFNLNGLSATDLSQFQNVKAANNVFEPWATNKRALGDAALTSHWRTEEETGNGYRLEDGGKYFHEDNVNYIRKQRAAFAADKAESWQEYYANKRSYTPYHDVNEEINKLMKDFKPSSYKIDRISGLYKFTDENASWTQAEIRKYLEANLSEKAKTQIKIHADVRYNNDPKQLGQVYKNMAQNEMKQYNDGIAFIDKKLSSTTKKEEIDELKAYKTKLEDKKKALGVDIQAIDNGDYTMIKKKGEGLAYGIYFNELMNKVSNGWSHADVVHKISGNEVGLALMHEARADARQQAGFRHAEKMAMMKGEIPGSAPQMRRLLSGEEEQFTRESAGKKIDEYRDKNSKLVSDNDGMVATWKSTLPQNKGKSFRVEDITDDDRRAYMTSGMAGKPLPSEHPYMRNLKQIGTNDRSIEIYNAQLRNIENKVIEGYSEDKRNQIQNIRKEREALVNKIGSVTFEDGTTISAERLAEGMKNGTIKVSRNYISDAFWGAGEKTIDVTMNGKTHTVTLPRGADPTASDLGERIAYGRNFKAIYQLDQLNEKGAYGNLQEDVDNYIKTNYKEVGLHSNIMTFADGTYEAKSLTASAINLFPTTQYDIQHAGIGADEINQSSAYFYITPKAGAKNVTQDQIVGYLKQQGYTDASVIETTGGPSLVRIGNFQNQIMSQYAQYNQEERQIIHQLVVEDNARDRGKFMTSTYNSNSSRPLAVMRDHGSYWLMVQGLDGGSDLDILPYPFSTPESAVLKGQQLTSTIGNQPEALLQNYINLANQ
jgi:hypothetical protein